MLSIKYCVVVVQKKRSEERGSCFRVGIALVWFGIMTLEINLKILNYLNEKNDVCLNQPVCKEESLRFVLRSLIPKVNADDVPFRVVVKGTVVILKNKILYATN